MTKVHRDFASLKHDTYSSVGSHPERVDMKVAGNSNGRRNEAKAGKVAAPPRVTGGGRSLRTKHVAFPGQLNPITAVNRCDNRGTAAEGRSNTNTPFK